MNAKHIVLFFFAMFHVVSIYSQPPNDECVNAIPLTVGSGVCNFTTGTNVGATASVAPAPGCGNYQGGDVWFSFVVPPSGHVVINTQHVDFFLQDYAMAIYSGTCGNLTLIECNDDDSEYSWYMPKIERSGLNPGETIYIRVWEYGNNSFGNFNICVFEVVTGSGPCASVIGINCNQSVSTSIPAGSGSWNTQPCGSGTPGNERVYAYTPAISGAHYLNITATNGQVGSYAYKPDNCNSIGWTCIVRTSSPGYYGPINLIAGTTYYFLVDNENAGQPLNHTFRITCPETPGNYLHPTSGLQNTYVGACMVNTCSGIYKDDGDTGPYSPNVNRVYRTFCPDQNNKCLRATLTEFVLEGGSGCPYDWFIIRNGPTQNSPALWGACGDWTASLPMQFTSTDQSGCLTFTFKSDNSVQLAGWTIEFDCVDCPNNPPSNNDCFTATAICDAVNFNAASVGPGITSTCGGCNLSENYSSWYYFEITSDGRLAINVKPENFFEDYDLALYRADNCSQLGDPIRCTYAQAPYYCYLSSWWSADCSSAQGRRITRVQFNTLDRSSACESYRRIINNYQTIVNTGQTYPLSVTVAGGNGCYITAWFDWNKNLTFDAGEEYVIASNVGAGTYTQNITIPSGARPGYTLMRIIVNRGSAPTACGSVTRGEIEDYSIFINDGTQCSNNIKDANEDGVDCGGPCVPCDAAYWPTNTGLNSIATDYSEDVTGDSWVHWVNVTAGESYYLMINNWSPGASGFDITFNFSEGGAMDCTILPVEMLSFDARCREYNLVDISWTTASEVNNDYFVVMKSYNGFMYAPIDTVRSRGNSNELTQYNFTYREHQNSIVYYKLKQVDRDGKFKFIGPIVIQCEQEQLDFVVYPNPAHQVLYISTAASSTYQKGFVHIYDVKGQMVYYEQISIGMITSIDISSLPSGTYYAILNVDGVVRQHTFVKN